jgi:hypothetical protein
MDRLGVRFRWGYTPTLIGGLTEPRPEPHAAGNRRRPGFIMKASRLNHPLRSRPGRASGLESDRD